MPPSINVPTAPTAPSQATPAEPKHTAGIWRRIGTLFLDAIGNYIFGWVVGFVCAFSIVLAGGKMSLVINLLVGVLSWFIYFVLFETIWQRTPGKWITKTKVVCLDGSKPGFGRIVGRTLARWIPLEALSFYGKHPYGWHDRISGTMVVPITYSPQDAATVNPNERGKSWVSILIVSFIPAMVILGILSSILLVSLGGARVKGADASVVLSLSQARVAAELSVYSGTSTSTNYSGVCADSTVVQNLKNASKAGSSVSATNLYSCNATTTEWAASVPLRSGGYSCVDSSTSPIRTIATALTNETSCTGLFPYEGGK